jgi:hypothetical protein
VFELIECCWKSDSVFEHASALGAGHMDISTPPYEVDLPVLQVLHATYVSSLEQICFLRELLGSMHSKLEARCNETQEKVLASSELVKQAIQAAKDKAGDDEDDDDNGDGQETNDSKGEDHDFVISIPVGGSTKNNRKAQEKIPVSNNKEAGGKGENTPKKNRSSGQGEKTKPVELSARERKEKQLPNYSTEELAIFNDEELDKLIAEVQELANKEYKEKHQETVRKEFEEAQKAKAKAEEVKKEQEAARKRAVEESKLKKMAEIRSNSATAATKLLMEQERKRLLTELVMKTAPAAQTIDTTALDEQLRKALVEGNVIVG